MRLLILNAIEKIEIAFRTKLINEYSASFGSHWFKNINMYRNKKYFQKDMNNLNEEIGRSSETFIKHYKEKYSFPEHPPVWMTLEVVSIGLLSKLFSNLINNKEKKNIAKAFGLPAPVFLESWIHAIANLRNLCAHHSRIWNRRYTIKIKMPFNTSFPFIENYEVKDNKLYIQLSCIVYLLNLISPGHSFINNFKVLIKSCHLIKLKDMGFPEEWEREPVWRI